jgi:heme/copper-type cytochrome/quinol oxidase subunit 2
MPIMVRAVPKEEFHAWVTDAQERFAQGPTGQSPNRTTQLAQQ